MNQYSIVCQGNYLSLLFWMTAFMYRVFSATHFSHSVCWIYHATPFCGPRFCGGSLLLTSFVFPYNLDFFFLLLSGCFYYLYILQIVLQYVFDFGLFCWIWWGFSISFGFGCLRLWKSSAIISFWSNCRRDFLSFCYIITSIEMNRLLHNNCVLYNFIEFIFNSSGFLVD